MMYTLIENIYSPMRGSLYGAAGDPVKVVSAQGDVWIVEDKHGERFPVRKERLQEGQAQAPIKAAAAKAPAPEALPIPEITMISKPAARGKKAAAPPNQNSLF